MRETVLEKLTPVQRTVLNVYLKNNESVVQASNVLNRHHSTIQDALVRIEKTLGIPRTALKSYVEKETVRTEEPSKESGPRIRTTNTDFDIEKGMGRMHIESDSPISIEDALLFAGFDHNNWVVTKVKVGGHQTPIRTRQGQDENKCWLPDIPIKVWCTVWGIEAKPKYPEIKAAESILADMKKNSTKVPKIVRGKIQKSTRRALEVDFPDVHLGLRCFAPAADISYSPEEAVALVRSARDSLLETACTKFGPFEEILWFFGHDWLHCDNLQHTTTQGTSQPESDSYQTIYRIGFDLAVETVNVLKEIAPVVVPVIPGNHDRVSCMTMGLALEAYFHNDENVTIDASTSPYKFWKYGVNLIGSDHGHSLKANRLASLMAAETRTTGWADAEYCEWHLGDQHRAGQGTPIKMEEQSVSIEYLPGLTAPNEWHRLKGFNSQKRCATGFIWGYNSGQEARLRAIVRPGTNKLA